VASPRPSRRCSNAWHPVADDEVSFYAHAKGVKYEPTLPRSVKRWAELQYAVTLDDWLAVREQLDRFAMTGIFRKHGPVRQSPEPG